MDRTAADQTAKHLILSFNRQISQAAGLASAAAHLAQSGNTQAATKLVLDAEDSILDAQRLLEATVLIGRICQSAERDA